MNILAFSTLGSGLPEVCSVALRAADMHVEFAEDADDAVALVQHHDFAAVVTTSHLVMRRLRAIGSRIPILGLDERQSSDVCVEWLNDGADDCLTVPCHGPELVARLRAIVRRAHGLADNTITVGEITLRPDQQWAIVKGERLHLTGKEFALLHMLAVRGGQLVTKDQAMTELYAGRDEPEPKIIDVFICKLRKKLTDVGVSGVIRTEWDRGYSLHPTSAEKAQTAGPELREAMLRTLAEADRPAIIRTINAALSQFSPTSIRHVLNQHMTAGLIEAVGRGVGMIKTYRLTDAGRAVLATA